MEERTMGAWVALALDAGLRVGEGTRLRVVGAMPHRGLMHAVAEGAYRRGASLVRLEYNDPRLSRIRVDASRDGFLDEVPLILEREAEVFTSELWSSLVIVGDEDPDAMEGADEGRLTRVQRGPVEAGLGGGGQQRGFGRVARDPPRAVLLAQVGGVAERGARQRGAQRGVLKRSSGGYVCRHLSVAHEELALGRVAHAGDFVLPASGDHDLHGHLVARQRAGLVGADDRYCSDRLARVHLTHEIICCGHLPHAVAKAQRHTHGQPFWNCHHHDRHCDHEILQYRLPRLERHPISGRGRYETTRPATADRRDELKEIREAARPKPKLLQGGKAQAAKVLTNTQANVCHSETNTPEIGRAHV